MSSAVIGLVGVVIGALATSGTQLFLEWQRGRRAFRRALLLVASELAQNALLLQVVAKQEKVPLYRRGFPLTSSAWEAARSDLAVALDSDLFTRLALTYRQLETNRERLRLAPWVFPRSKAFVVMAKSLGEDAEGMEKLRLQLLALKGAGYLRALRRAQQS